MKDVFTHALFLRSEDRLQKPFSVQELRHPELRELLMCSILLCEVLIEQKQYEYKQKTKRSHDQDCYSHHCIKFRILDVEFGMD